MQQICGTKSLSRFSLKNYGTLSYWSTLCLVPHGDLKVHLLFSIFWETFPDSCHMPPGSTVYIPHFWWWRTSHRSHFFFQPGSQHREIEVSFSCEIFWKSVWIPWRGCLCIVVSTHNWFSLPVSDYSLWYHVKILSLQHLIYFSYLFFNKLFIPSKNIKINSAADLTL